jgi:modification methylase
VRPYYEDDHVTIYHGDSREVLPSVPDFDLVLTSPPYNLSRDRKPSGSGSRFRALENGYRSHGDDLPHAEYVEWQRDLLRAMWDRLPDDGAIYYQHKPLISRGERAHELLTPFDLIPPETIIRQIITWDRGAGFIRRPTYYVPRFEWIILLAREGFRITMPADWDLWHVSHEHGGEHPAPFPLALASRVMATTHPGVWLDPFMGSGTTLRAAKDAGRKAIGIEIDEAYCEIAAKRMGQEVLDLGGAA